MSVNVNIHTDKHMTHMYHNLILNSELDVLCEYNVARRLRLPL